MWLDKKIDSSYVVIENSNEIASEINFLKHFFSLSMCNKGVIFVYNGPKMVIPIINRENQKFFLDEILKAASVYEI